MSLDIWNAWKLKAGLQDKTERKRWAMLPVARIRWAGRVDALTAESLAGFPTLWLTQSGKRPCDQWSLSASWWLVAHSTCIGLVLPPLSLEGSLWQRPHGVCLPVLLRVCGSITHPENVHNIVDTCSCQNFKQSLIRQNFRRFSWFFLKFPQAHSAALIEYSAAFLDAIIIIFSGAVYHVNVLTLPFSFLLLYGIWWLPINFKHCLKY